MPISFFSDESFVEFQRGKKGTGTGRKTLHPGVGRGHGGKTGKGARGGPGARGGKYWVNAKGNIEYGAPPSGVKAKTPQQWQSHVNQSVRKLAHSIKSAADLSKLGPEWEVGVDGPNTAGQEGQPGGYNHFGSGAAGKAAALASATQAASTHKDITYAILKVDGNYVVAAASTKDLLAKSPDREGGASAADTTNQPPANVA